MSSFRDCPGDRFGHCTIRTNYAQQSNTNISNIRGRKMILNAYQRVAFSRVVQAAAVCLCLSSPSFAQVQTTKT